jgi:hypothetical protein
MSDEKKIIIDEDWKSRVEAEKEELERKRHDAKSSTGDGPTAPSAADEGGEAMPPASFEMLLTTLATEALVSLGQIPHPTTGKPEPHLDQARFLIDTLDILQQKTTGNLTRPEELALENLLHQLRMTFVAVQQHYTYPAWLDSKNAVS